MKALILDVTGHHNDAVDLARVAVKKDVKSHVCWHIFGMIMRSDRKFGEAMKALKMALHLSPDNPQILRDLALVQAHTRDFKGFQVCLKLLLFFILKFCVIYIYCFLVDALHLASSETKQSSSLDGFHRIRLFGQRL